MMIRVTRSVLLVLSCVLFLPADAWTQDCCGTKSVLATDQADSNGGSYIPDAVGIPSPAMMATNNGVTETQVEELLDRFHEVFPDIRFRVEWKDFTVNAIAYGNNGKDAAGNDAPVDYGKRNVVVFGGMARHPALGLEGLSIIIAHEVGHHYGETERVDVKPTSNSPTYSHGAYCEGQSDFWATRVGMRLVYNFESKTFNDADYYADSAFKWDDFDDTADSDEYDRRIEVGVEQCHRFLSGGLFVDYDSFIVGSQNPAGHDHEDEAEVTPFNGCGHPQAACRKKLYLSGSTKSERPDCTQSASAFSFFGRPFEPTTEASWKEREKSGVSSFGGGLGSSTSEEVQELRKEVAELKQLLLDLKKDQAGDSN